MNNIYGGYFTDGNYPARVTLQVAALPRGANVEISAIAYK
jgi:2-iminobutanoate/2-iminopropanoate deaminase